VKDYYKIIGVDRNASTIEIKRTFREKALLIHPDKSKSATGEEFIELFEAYSILTDIKKKEKYNSLYDFFNSPNEAAVEEELKIDLLAITAKGQEYAANYNRFDREIMWIILFELGGKFAIATVACLFYGIWTILKGLYNFEFDYMLVGLILSLVGLAMLRISYSRVKNN
jgi:hypothetical protein